MEIKRMTRKEPDYWIRFLDAVNDSEQDIVTEIALRAGVWWQCSTRGDDGFACLWNNIESATHCCNCGSRKPNRKSRSASIVRRKTAKMPLTPAPSRKRRKSNA